MKSPEFGRTYMQKTFYGLADIFSEGHGEEGDPGEPLKFKIYQDVTQYPLCQSLQLTLGDARCSFFPFHKLHSPVPGVSALSRPLLSALLYYTFGFSRHDTGEGVRWPFHRLIPSARCFYPNELYLWIPEIDLLPAGIYQYDNLHHSLACLRRGDYRDLLSAILGNDLHDSLAVLLISSHFWKNAFRYRNFSYRLCSQEAGIVAGNALLVAGALGLQGRIHYQFLDRPANRLLGFESLEESLFAAIPLFPAEARDLPWQPRSTLLTAEYLLEEIESISPQHIKLGTLDPDLCPLVIEMDQYSFMESTGEFVTAATERLPACDESEQRIFPPPVLDKELELAWALHRRHSGDMLFTPLQCPLSQEAFWEIIRYSLSPYLNDLNHEANMRTQLYIAINSVEGLEQGIYRLCNHCGTLHEVERRDVTQDTFLIHNSPTVACHTANIVCYIVADYLSLDAVFGNRSYRIMNMENGLVAQRLCVMSAAFGLAARCSDSYDIKRCEELLRLTGQAAMPTFLVAIGHERPGVGVRYRHSIRF